MSDYQLNPTNILEDKEKYAAQLHELRARRLIYEKKASRAKTAMQSHNQLAKAFEKKIAQIDKMLIDIETRLDKLEAKIVDTFGELND